MNIIRFIGQSLRFRARTHVGPLLGACIGGAVLTGALLLGDSISFTLRRFAEMRLGKTEWVINANDRQFSDTLGQRIQTSLPGVVTAPMLHSAGIASVSDGSARANHVEVYGMDANFWKLAEEGPGFDTMDDDSAVLSESVAEQLKLKAGDSIVLRILKPSLLSQEAPVSSQKDQSAALRLKLGAVVADQSFGRFSLQSSQIPPLNIFINLRAMQRAQDLAGRANILLISSAPGVTRENVESAIQKNWEISDAQLELRDLPASHEIELRSSRVFLEPAVVSSVKKAATPKKEILTYFVNELRSDATHATPYSMVSAMGEPMAPAGMRDDEIVITDWLADDLQIQLGASIKLSYFVLAGPGQLKEQSSSFKVREIIPLASAGVDRELMPEFPGLENAETSHDWDTGFPIDLQKIRPKDEQFWKDHRGTPKAFVTLAAGEQMWTNRFGELTAIRFDDSQKREAIAVAIQKQISPASVGLAVQPVRAEGRAAASNGQDFAGLFVSFSFFLVLAALVLMGLLTQFSLEQRLPEVGTLLALGFTVRRVRWMFWLESLTVGIVGSIAGIALGFLYAKGLLWALTTVWRPAIGVSRLMFHAEPMSIVIGAFSNSILAAIIIAVLLRKYGSRPIPSLLSRGAIEAMPAGKRKKGWMAKWVATLTWLSAIGLSFEARASKEKTELFFTIASLVLIGALAIAAIILRSLQTFEIPKSRFWFAIKQCATHRQRSLATVILIASGVFLLIAVSAYHLETGKESKQRNSGTGGFEWIAETALPVVKDLNTKEGRDLFGLDQPEFHDVAFVPFRVHTGEDASCLNLNQAQNPTILGVVPAELEKRGAFQFGKTLSTDKSNPWNLLDGSGPEIPAIADEASIEWVLKKKIGDVIETRDDAGHIIHLKLVAALANSVLQGKLIISDANFTKVFPLESGHRMFLIDGPSNVSPSLQPDLSRAFRDMGMEIMPAAARLQQFNAVQNTYLSTFQLLGGLGLLLGSAGLAVVLLRNALERRGQLALMSAVGFPRLLLQQLLLVENGALLVTGLLAGAVSAAAAVAPGFLEHRQAVPLKELALALLTILASGLFCAWLASKFALQGGILKALRDE